ncbi:hypothetical protein EWM64_g4765 [Hericium alpestre]|uniref:Uncharacterized protein n=1 Tax=Hericium alpestre TaxID=135208 RepID=A0A4Y9ZWR0_9AGAM|nr:hypothetical protein EWM64_g4765 [Hericium alpestre]
MHLLSIFPSDEEIAEIAAAAFEEASILWSLLGYDLTAEAPTGSGSATPSLSDDDVDQKELLERDEASEDMSEKQELQNALTQASSLPTLPSNSTDIILDECTFAAASLNMEEYEHINSLPDEDPAQLDELRAGLAQILNTFATPEQEEDNSHSKDESGHRLLAHKIHETLKLEEDRGYMGLIRCTHWVKSAAGAGDKKAQDETVETETGNTANARMAAQSGATAITRRCQKAFAGSPAIEIIVTAKVDMISHICKDSWGLVLVDDNLMLGKVLTMYEKGDGKAAKHSWISTSSSIAAISYLPVQVWQHGHQRQFRAMHGKCLPLRIPRFAHLLAAAFLCLVPTKSIRTLPGASNNMELLAGAFEDIYIKLSADKPQLVLAVRDLLRPSRRASGDK